jgi:RNA polymerase sigma-70 factor (ECF subfamily)
VDLHSVSAELAPRLLAYALARTGCRASAEDIAQDALTALVRRWQRVGPPDSPQAFVFAIASRRATRLNARRFLLAPLELLNGASGNGASAEESLDQRRELARILRAARRLTRRDRETLLLRAVGELPIGEIAAITGSTPAAVKMRLQRARKRLAANLSEPIHDR